MGHYINDVVVKELSWKAIAGFRQATDFQLFYAFDKEKY